MHLNSQLTALSTSLIRTREWVAHQNGAIHHTLVIGLESTLECCDALASKLYDELSSLWNSDDVFDALVKVRFILNGSALKQVSTMIQAQPNALQILLTACNCQSFSTSTVSSADLVVKRTWTVSTRTQPR